MQGLTRKVLERPDQFRRGTARRRGSRPIALIADQRAPDMGQMDADLMGPTSLKLYRQECMPRQGFKHPIMGDGRSAMRDNGHPGTLGGMAADRCIDPPAADEHALGQGKIFAMDAALPKLFHQGAMGLQGTGYHHQPSGLLIEPMDDASARQGGQGGVMMEERILEGAVWIACCRMDDQTGRFIDDQEMGVLIDDVEVDRLRTRTIKRYQLGLDTDRFTAKDPVAAAVGATIDQDLSRLDPALEMASRKLRQQPCQDPIQSLAVLFNLIGRDPQEPPHKHTGIRGHGAPASRAWPPSSWGSGILGAIRNGHACTMSSSGKRLVVIVLATLIAGCGIFGKQGDETEDWSAAKLYAKAAAELKAGSYQRAIELYEKLEARYPFGRYAMQAQLDVAYAHYRADEPEEALAAADRFIKLYPQNPHVDYAYYLKGIINYNRGIGFLERFIPTDASQRDPGAALESFKDFATLVERFPNSKYAEDARQRMVYLRNNLAMNEVHVARYYLKRGAYLAAANRANHVIQHYQRTSAVDDALEVLIAAYRALGKDDLAADAQRVLDLNRQAGRFVPEPAPPKRPDLLQQVWETLKLDQD